MLSPGAPLPPDIKLAGSVVLIIATVGTVMITCDAWVIDEMRQLPRGFVEMFDILIDLGKSGWILFPIVGLLMLSCYARSYAPKRYAKLVIATLEVRLSFLFLAIGVPGLVSSFATELIGRARPYVADGDPFIFHPLAFHAQYASLPSGHSTTAFAAAVAIGAVWPHLRPSVWSYALLVAASRVIVIAHFPSDVLASAIVGVLGALLVRNYFASRRLVFSIRSDGSVYALPGPSWKRLRAVTSSINDGA